MKQCKQCKNYYTPIQAFISTGFCSSKCLRRYARKKKLNESKLYEGIEIPADQPLFLIPEKDPNLPF